MRVPAIVSASEGLIVEMDDKVFDQVTNVATRHHADVTRHAGRPLGLRAFSIGGVATFDAEEGGIVSAGGVGFDVSLWRADASHSSHARASGRCAAGIGRRALCACAGRGGL